MGFYDGPQFFLFTKHSEQPAAQQDNEHGFENVTVALVISGIIAMTAYTGRELLQRQKVEAESVYFWADIEHIRMEIIEYTEGRYAKEPSRVESLKRIRSGFGFSLQEKEGIFLKSSDSKALKRASESLIADLDRAIDEQEQALNQHEKTMDIAKSISPNKTINTVIDRETILDISHK